MTLPALATLDDVAAIVGRSLSATETTNGTRLLGMASGMVRRYTRQTITQVVGDVVTLPGNWGHTIVLPELPVTSVASVVVNSITAPVSGWTVIGNELFLGTGSYSPDYGTIAAAGGALWGPAGSTNGMQIGGPSWQGPSSKVTVTYTHGFVEVPADIVNEVAGMVALQLSTSVGVDQEQIGGYKVNYQRGEGGGMALTAETKAVLNFYRKRALSATIATRR